MNKSGKIFRKYSYETVDTSLINMMLNANDVSEYLKLGKYSEVGKHTLLMRPQIANQQILGLIPLSQIRTFLRCPSPQIANVHDLPANRKSAIYE